MIIPGTIALDGVLADQELRTAIAALVADAAIVASVCTGAFCSQTTGC